MTTAAATTVIAPEAILLAAYGSRLAGVNEAMDNLLQLTLAAFPGCRVEQVFTGGTHHGTGPGGGPPRTAEQAMRDLAGEGVRRLAVQSLHVLPGREFQDLKKQVERLRPEFAAIGLGRPLLGSDADVRTVASTLASALKEAARPGEAVLLMGHGTRGAANNRYQELANALRGMGARVLIGALEAEPGLSEKVEELRALGVGTVHLMPLLFARGKHTRHDMAGEGGGSWRSGLAAAGFDCQVHEKGAGERPELAGVWLDHLREAVAALGAAVKV
jgi:sirohydrochlorin cobaltochelatase